MTDRRGFVALFAVLAVVAGLLTWGVVGRSEERCLWAITVGTDQYGYVEVPCAGDPVETLAYLREHPNLPLVKGPSPTGGVTLEIFCKPGNRPAPGNDPANC